MDVLQVDGVHVAGGAGSVLAGVDLRVAAGERVGITGMPGCGKSTLLRVMAGVQQPAAGTVRHASAVRLVPEDPDGVLDPARRVWEAVTDHAAGRPAGWRRDAAAALLERFGLPAAHLDRTADQGSRGERHRLAIAQALCGDPAAVLADEPLAALDVRSRHRVVQALRGAPAALVVASADLAGLLLLVDRVVVLHGGVVVERGPAAAVVADPQHEVTRALAAALQDPFGDPGSQVPLDAARVVPERRIAPGWYARVPG